MVDSAALRRTTRVLMGPMKNGPSQALKSGSCTGVTGSCCPTTERDLALGGFSKNGSASFLAWSVPRKLNIDASVPPFTPPRIENDAFTLWHGSP